MRRIVLLAGLQVLISKVGKDVSQHHAHGELRREFARVTDIQRHLVRVDGLRHAATVSSRRVLAGCDLSERKIAERGAERLIVAAAEFIIAGKVGEENIVDNLAQPRGIGKRKTSLGICESILGGIPELRVHIRIGRRSEVTHGTSARIRRNAQRGHSGVDRVELVVLDVVLRCRDGNRRAEQHAY